MEPAVVSGLRREWPVAAVLATALIALAALSLLRPGAYLVPAFTGYLCFLLVGYVEAQCRGSRSTAIAAPPVQGRDDWAARLNRLESLIIAMTETAPQRPAGNTLH